jgi:hypothetical protein
MSQLVISSCHKYCSRKTFHQANIHGAAAVGMSPLKKTGKSGQIISVERSVRKLTKPRARTLP